MHITALNKEQLLNVYDRYVKEDFPADEIKPRADIERFYDQGIYHPLGLFDKETLAAYALIAVSGKTVLIDYFAVIKERRSRGEGTFFLREIRKKYGGDYILLAEAEDPRYAGYDKKTKERRLAFYKRNGMFDTGLSIRVFGVVYRILADDDSLTEAAAYGLMMNMYQSFGLSKRKLKENTEVMSQRQG